MPTRIPTAVRVADPADPGRQWNQVVRYAAAAALCGLGVLWFVGDLVFLGHEGEDRSAWIAAHPLLSGLGVSAEILGVPLIFAAAMVWFTLSRPASPRWAWAGVVLLTCAAAAQGVLVGAELVGYVVARSRTGLDAALSAVMDHASGPPMVTFMVLFFVGAFLGILVSMVAVWRARVLPRAAVVLVVASQALELVDVPLGGTGVTLIALTWMAIHLVRVPPSPAPVPRGA
jgi:hypothetical protein